MMESLVSGTVQCFKTSERIPSIIPAAFLRSKEVRTVYTSHSSKQI